jgi:ribosome-associated translation inhibitor RaiA
MSDFKRILKYSEVSDILTGNRNTIRINRPNESNYKALNELYEFLQGWVEKHSKKLTKNN